jgi:ribosome maturation protein Sdo1
MPTQLQRKLAKRIVETADQVPPISKGDLLESAGYSRETANASAERQITLKGTQQALQELGFHPDAAKQVVQEILHRGKSEKNRLTAADMVFKVSGTYAPEKRLNVNVDIDQDAATELLTAASKMGEEIKNGYADGKT